MVVFTDHFLSHLFIYFIKIVCLDLEKLTMLIVQYIHVETSEACPNVDHF
jgi:hypothetical protein